MTTPYLEVSFRHGRPFAAYLHCAAPRPSAVSRPLGRGLILDLDADGVVLGLEVTDPQHVHVADITAALAPYGVDISEIDLVPLAA